MRETSIEFSEHDHGDCKTSALMAAEQACALRGLQFTPVRRCALEILLENHKALGAYDVLARLGQEGFGDKPPVAYRALSFLTENGFAHRIERLNAFVACAHSGQMHRPGFLICRVCRDVAEVETAGAGTFDDQALKTGFHLEEVIVEAIGTCPACTQETQCV
ncbi:transcriptional repressor [Aestuariibius sp. HNIBRBA575]|uniref:transcriptional repressor n=1 Tax=Aestuariibius sp. HNIBRBA575 TaxID=3233343 RepID=UPI0034A30DDB